MKHLCTELLPRLVVLAILTLAMGACSNNPASPPLSQFQPQISNAADNFQFQATGTTNVTTTVEYPWQNSGTKATINQSCAITGGSAILTLLDSNQVQVYSSSLAANGTFQSSVGITGAWKVRVVLTNVSGTLNFRAQKL